MGVKPVYTSQEEYGHIPNSTIGFDSKMTLHHPPPRELNITNISAVIDPTLNVGFWGRRPDVQIVVQPSCQKLLKLAEIICQNSRTFVAN